MMLAFVDLDDSLFQTREKSPEGVELVPAALDREGRPLSFTTPGERTLLELLQRGAVVVPVTGRNLAAFRRVLLPFDSGAILNHGATILDAAGAPDPEWEQRVARVLDGSAERLSRAFQALSARADRLGVRVRLISDFGRDLYVSIKAERGTASGARPDVWEVGEREGLRVIANGRDLALLPPEISKERAVRLLRSRLTAKSPGALVLGLGDATSDAGFLAECDYAMMPGKSPLFSTLRRALAREEVVGPGGGFSGSYGASDVTFLLQPIRMEPLETEEKERLIQSKRLHYSELIGRESRPSERYLAAFDAALARNRRRFAADLLELCRLIDQARTGEVTLVSLARAGTPVGVIAARLLRRWFGRTVHHYSISIIRDRGIDENALRHILERARPESLVFLDGWTGKGVIARELERSLAGFATRSGIEVPPELFVVADLSGSAAFRATLDDYLIPSAILNATISGLVSRSISNAEHLGPGEFHGCLYLSELAPFDRSRAFAEDIERTAAALVSEGALTAPPAVVGGDRRAERLASDTLLTRLMTEHGVSDENHVKPGIGEATRVLLRRVPELLIVRDLGDADVAHLCVLAEERKVPVRVDRTLLHKAVALIKVFGHGVGEGGES